ncbi:hypothetical protein KOSB73_320021 [Klebsiella grimontii]|uniref:Uncharacterized protein n=1 Tax=Klebsiella grimontii TaxID=2058152 RepID=A0A285B8V4_9ENTR|nr:hypothetical protein KOSB73_320021 [Klebsiella grimontii]
MGNALWRKIGKLLLDKFQPKFFLLNALNKVFSNEMAYSKVVNYFIHCQYFTNEFVIKTIRT